MPSDRSKSRARTLAAVAALCLSVLSGSAQGPGLRIVSAGPSGELAQLADADQVRIVFSEPMVPLGTIPSNTTPPWIHMTPAAAGTFYWSGTKTLIFSPDTSSPLPFATMFTVRVDATATSVAGRALEEPYSFAFTTPTARLLQAEGARKTSRFDSPALLMLRFNQPVRPGDVLAHARVVLTPHEWKPPELSPEARQHLRHIDPAGLSRFDDKVAAVHRVTSSSDQVAVRLAESWDEGRFPRTPDRVVLETTMAPAPDAWLTIELDETLPGLQGPRAHVAQSATVRLESTFFVQRVSCEGVCGPWPYKAIGLTRPVAFTRFTRALTVADVTDPLLERTVIPSRTPDADAQELTSSPDMQQLGYETQPPARTWRLELTRDLEAADGQVLGYPWVGFVDHMHAIPFVAFDGAVWEAGGGPSVPVHSRNVLSIAERFESVSRSSVMSRLLAMRSRSLLPSSAEGRTRQLDVTPDAVQVTGLDTRHLLSRQGTGLFWAAVDPLALLPRHAPPEGTIYEIVSPFNQIQQRALIQVTNLGISVKDSPQSTLVFVTRLDTAAPVLGARVAIVDSANRTRWRGVTDRDGVALAPAMVLRSAEEPGDLSFIVTAEAGSDFAFVASNWTEGDLDDWRTEYGYSEPANVLRGSVFTDRGVYRAGETVHLKAIVRVDTPTSKALLPPGTPLDVVVHDGRGREIDRRSVRVNRWSSAEWTWDVPAEAALGYYQIDMVRAGASSTTNGYGPSTNVAGRFLVAAYRQPDFRVETALSGDPPVLGSSLRGTVDAKYLFGAALGSRLVRWQLSRVPVLTAPAALRERYRESQYAVGYLRESDDAGPFGVSIVEKSETLDADGHLSLSLPTASDSDLAYAYTLESDVEGASGQHISNRARVVVHPASIYVAISRPPMFVETKTGANVSVAAVDLSGKTVPGVSVAVSLKRVDWMQLASESPGRSKWQRRETAAGDWTVSTTGGEIPLSIPIRDGGSYILRAIARDVSGRSTRTDVSFYALGPGASSWRSDGNRIDLTPEREMWKPGDTARILIHSPWEHATGLVTIEREGIRSHRAFTVSSTQHAIEVPITDADVPNVYVSVLLVKGRTTGGVIADGIDPDQPSYRIGYVELSVDDSSKRLRVDVSADRQEYRPRQPLKVAVAVTKPDGRPVVGEVALWAVDYALLSLTDYKTPDLVKAIYVPKALEVATADSRAQLMSRRPLRVLDGVPGGVMGGVLGGLASTVQVSMSRRGVPPQPPSPGVEIRQDFRPLVFWLGSTTTDASGRATTTVTLPDSLTTYRIMAVAGDRASQFGFGEREVRVTKPLTLLTAFPRFLHQGDRASIGGVVTNSGPAGGMATVTIESLAPDILQFGGSATQTVNIAAGASTAVTFDALAHGSGGARVRMSVALGGQQDALEMPLDVARPTRVETTAAYGETAGTATEKLALPAGVVPGAGGLTVEVASTALVGLGEAARYLDEYPYECAEQKTSRALALLLGSDLGGTFKLSNARPDAQRAAAAKALTDLYSYQCDLGGFSLWPGRCETVSVYLTAYVLHTMDIARRGQTGVRPGSDRGQTPIAIDPAAITRALDYLERNLDDPPQRARVVARLERLAGLRGQSACGVRPKTSEGNRPPDRRGLNVSPSSRCRTWPTPSQRRATGVRATRRLSVA